MKTLIVLVLGLSLSGCANLSLVDEDDPHKATRWAAVVSAVGEANAIAAGADRVGMFLTQIETYASYPGPLIPEEHREDVLRFITPARESYLASADGEFNVWLFLAALFQAIGSDVEEIPQPRPDTT